MRIFASLTVCAALLAHGALGAVTLSSNGGIPEYRDVSVEPISSATLFFVDSVPVLHWGEAGPAPASAANSLYSDAPVAAYATYDRASHNATGWGRLWLTTTADVPMLDAIYAAGYLGT